MRNKILVTLQFLVSVLIIIIFSCSPQAKKESPQPPNIPKEAFLKLSKKGSFWYHIINVHDHRNNAVISIYDTAGKIVITKKFIMICQVIDNPIWIQDLKKQIQYFDGNRILLERPAGKDSCWLQ